VLRAVKCFKWYDMIWYDMIWCPWLESTNHRYNLHPLQFTRVTRSFNSYTHCLFLICFVFIERKANIFTFCFLCYYTYIVLKYGSLLAEAGNFFFTTVSRPALGPTQPPIQWVPVAISLGVKRPGREADHTPPSSAEDMKAWSYTSTPPIRLHGVVLS
jgi:hypothetical protein